MYAGRKTMSRPYADIQILESFIELLLDPKQYIISIKYRITKYQEKIPRFDPIGNKVSWIYLFFLNALYINLYSPFPLW